MNLRKIGALGISLGLGFSLSPGLVIAAAKPSPSPSAVAQATAESACVALQEITTGDTEVRKRIENRVLGHNNWNTDFLVPSNQPFRYFVAIITPENTATYEMSVHLRLPTGASEPAFSTRADVQAGVTFSIPFQSPTGRQPSMVNVRVGGVNGNVYTIGVAACP